MRSLFLSLIFIISANFSAFAKSPIRTVEGIVKKVNSGDTIEVTISNGTKLKVRLYGIDAPETGQPHSTGAQKALEEMVINQHVRLEIMSIDQYKNSVAIVWTAGHFVNKEMVRTGWAWGYPPEFVSQYTTEYIYLEEKARRERRGLWEQSNHQPPWEFKKQLKKIKLKNRS